MSDSFFIQTAEAATVALGIAIDFVSCRKKSQPRISQSLQSRCRRKGTSTRPMYKTHSPRFFRYGAFRGIFKTNVCDGTKTRQQGGEVCPLLRQMRGRGKAQPCFGKDRSVFLIPDAAHVFKGLTC